MQYNAPIVAKGHGLVQGATTAIQLKRNGLNRNDSENEVEVPRRRASANLQTPSWCVRLAARIAFPLLSTETGLAQFVGKSE